MSLWGQVEWNIEFKLENYSRLWANVQIYAKNKNAVVQLEKGQLSVCVCECASKCY